MTPGSVAVLLVASGAAAVLRHLVTVGSVALGWDLSRSTLPWPVLAVNTVGSLVAGIGWGLLLHGRVDAATELVIVTGVAGGLTTFSTLSVETVQLALAGRWVTAAASIAANLGAGTAALVAGLALAGGVS